MICYNPYSRTRRGGSSKHCCYSPEMVWVSGYCKEQPAAILKSGRENISPKGMAAVWSLPWECAGVQRELPSQEKQVISWQALHRVVERQSQRLQQQLCLQHQLCSQRLCFLCPGIWVMRLEQAEEHELRFLLPNVNIFSVTA